MATGLEENDVRYATGLVAPDPFYLLVAGSRRYLLVSALEAARARKTCPSRADFISWPDSARLRPLTPQENATRRTDVSSQNQRPD